MTKARKRLTETITSKVIIEFLEYVLMFTVIIECNSMFHYSENYRQTTMEVLLTLFAIVVAGVLAVVYGFQNKDGIHQELKKDWPIWSLLLGWTLLFLVLNVLRLGAENALRKYILSFLLFFPVSYLLLLGHRLAGKPHELLFKHSNLMVILAGCNLIVFAAVTLQPDIIRAQPFDSRWSGLGYLKGFVSYLDVCCILPNDSRTIAGITFYRNIGIFTEPVIYSIPLITALFTELFLRRKEDRRIWKWLILLISLAVSQSTLGMLLGAGAIGIKLVEGCKPKRRWLMVFPAIIMIAGAVFVLLRQKSDLGGSSTAAHIEHYVAAFQEFLEHPLLGCGYFREDQIVAHFASKNNKGLSNSIAVVLAEGGVFLGLFCITPFFVGLAQIRSKYNKRVALWTLGPLGLYCVTVFHFHLLLMLFFAFGYSMLEIAPAANGCKRKLALVDDVGSPQAHEPLSPTERIAKAIAILAGCGVAAALLLSGSFWQKISHWMQLRQLYFGQSSWKIYFFSLFLILGVLVVRTAIRAWGAKKDGPWLAETVWFILYSALFASTYPTAFSIASTALDISTPFGDFFETVALAVLYFGGVAVGWLLIALLRRSRTLFVAGIAAVAVLTVGAVTGAHMYASRIFVPTAEIAPIIRDASAAAKGKLYANERQAAMKHALPTLSYSPARDGAFAALKNASVVTGHKCNLRELFAAGFQIAELSLEYVLYSNDDAVIEQLQNAGYTFFKYYPFAMMPDNEAAIILKSGDYTLTAELQRIPETEAPHEPVGNILITSYYGTKQIKKQPVYADDFDAEGCARINVAFNSGNWEGMEYSFVPESGIELPSVSLALAETPSYLAETTYDGRLLLIYEAYYDLSGGPYYQSKGYAATSREYDRAGRLIRQCYYDGEGLPVIIKSGYASFTRAYNRQGRLWREAYYDENGSLKLSDKGYAAYEKEFDRKGNVISQRYLGENGGLIMLPDGYAEFHSVYNSKRQLLEERYYDENGTNVLLSKGYWMEKREYDDAGNVSVQRYYDTEGQSVVTAMGYAEIRREYNENKKVIREEYYGVNGERIALPNGAASQNIEYGADGKVSARHYFDLNGAEFTPES